MVDKKEARLNVRVDFFDENGATVSELFESHEAFQDTLDEILEFMSHMGIEKITLSGKTEEDDKKFREHLKERKVDLNN